MHYPSLTEYCDALQLSLGIALSDPLLGRGTLRSRGPGQPVVRSGNFALTFEVVTDGRSYAVRCFHKPADSLQARYDAIARLLRSIRSACFVDCEFQPSGITTESGTYPIVRMDWAHGETLAAFVAAHRTDSGTLGHLRVSLRQVANELRRHGIAHGDIQPTNIIVQSATLLRLIDYDGMFVPQLAGLQSAELGQRNFQHSGRRGRHFDAGLDAFAFSLLDLTLDALCRRPELWEQSDSDADAFILRAADIADPGSSPAFGLLASVPGFERKVRQFAAICAAPFEQVPSFEDFLAGRNVPASTVELTGDTALPLRREYIPSCDVVDATNFAQCCSHVGDRVEMIGRIVRVGLGPLPEGDTPCLRIEFADTLHDMACLKIWPEALARRENIPDATWVGQWVRAVGLVEPVHSAGSDSGQQKDVAISITDPSQLHRLTESEARHCLRAQRSRARLALDRTAGVKTDRVLPDAAVQAMAQSVAALPATRTGTLPASPWPASPAPPPVASSAAPRAAPPMAPAHAVPATPLPLPAAASRKAAIEPRGRRGWYWAAATLLFVFAGYAVIDRFDSSPAPPPLAAAPDTRPSAPAPNAAPAMAPSTAPAATGRLESQQALSKARLPLATIAGTLTLGPTDDSDPRPVVRLDGDAIAGLRNDAVSVTHRASYSDHEVVVGFTRCNGAIAPCGVQQPFWLELAPGQPPTVRRATGLWVGAGKGAGTVVASASGVQVDLGVWNGERRSATLTGAGSIAVARKREPRRPLSVAECATVIKAADSCATSRDCSTFKSSARPVPAPRWERLTRLYHESTGLDAAAFRALCVRSCELGLTPSDAFIRRVVCSGATPDQWPPGEPAAGL